MKTLALLVLLCAGLACAHFTTGGDFCDDEKERHDTCKPLVGCGPKGSHECQPPPPPHKPPTPKPPTKKPTPASPPPKSMENSGSGSGSGSEEGSGSHESSGSQEFSGSGVGSGSGEEIEYCFLLQIFWEFSFTLSIDIQIIFQEWIKETQITIVDSGISEYEILVKLYYSLQILFTEHVEIKTAVQFLYIGDWGYVCDLEGLVSDIQTANAEITIQEVITISGGSCPLTEALENCKHNASASEQPAIEQLIADITVIIQSSNSFSLKLTLIYQKFEALFVQYPDLKTLFMESEIDSFGVLQSYVDICAVYWRIDNFTFAAGGATSSCKLINALIAFYQNTSSGANVTTRSDIKELSDKCTANFPSQASDEARVQYFTEQVYQMLILSEWDIKFLYTIQIEGYGSIYELIYSYVYCINNGITPGDFTTMAPTTTSTSTTTTTTTTTTTKPSTTTVPNGNCATVSSVNVVSANITLLLSAIDADQKTSHWNNTLIATFQGYKQTIYKYSINSTATATQKFNGIKTVLTGFTTKSDFKAIVMAIFIQTWGTIGQYCACSM